MKSERGRNHGSVADRFGVFTSGRKAVCALERLLALVLGAERHEARHLELGEADFVAAELGEGEIGDLEGRMIHRGVGGLLWGELAVVIVRMEYYDSRH